jgi:hypothetical protein
MDMVTEGLREVGGDKSDDDRQVTKNHSHKNLREALGRTLNYFMQTRLSFLLIADSYRGKKNLSLMQPDVYK